MVTRIPAAVNHDHTLRTGVVQGHSVCRGVNGGRHILQAVFQAVKSAQQTAQVNRIAAIRSAIGDVVGSIQLCLRNVAGVVGKGTNVSRNGRDGGDILCGDVASRGTMDTLGKYDERKPTSAPKSGTNL